MMKKIFVAFVLFLTITPIQSLSAARFISPSEDSFICQKVGWEVTVYSIVDGRRNRLYDERISSDKAERQADGTVVYHMEHATIIEPASEDDPVLVKLDNVAVEGVPFSEELSLVAGNKKYTSKTKRENVFVDTKMVMKRLRGGFYDTIFF